MKTTTDDPSVNHLIAVVDRHMLRITAACDTEDNLPAGFKCIDIHAQFGSYKFIVDDEYEDIDDRNHPRALQALLLCTLDITDCGTYRDWLTRNRIILSESRLAAFERDFETFRKDYAAQADSQFSIVSSYDWQLNAAGAATLRKLPRELQAPFSYPVKLSAWVDDCNPSLPSYLMIFASGKILTQTWLGDRLITRSFNDRDSAFSQMTSENRKQVLYEISGQLCRDGGRVETGQVFEYWYRTAPGGLEFCVLVQTPGEPLQIRPFNTPLAGVIEFDSREQAHLSLRKAHFRLIGTPEDN